MPQVFSPGEAETRPLDPTAVVYTTAQKVADLLDIGPQEAVLMSANAEANAVFVTGNDYRNIGFSDEDKILIYSDADPMGLECTITGITSTASGVKLTFSETINPGLYEVADDGYVQNTASFTNGRTRGVTKDKVNSIILRMQDHIDNLTHNAWRPYFVAAEYINFDTYKPYRRRYYTDYVGTAPLLFRNVQQILRLELWQGDDYREIGAAEGRIQMPESVNPMTGSIVLSPGNGSVATLTIGTGTGQWRADFDKIATAQNLADLINKEDRVGKTAVSFSPNFTLEGSTSNVAVHNEFLATANSDYGSGIVKLTSMRSTKSGETCTMVSTNSDIEITQTQSRTTTGTTISATTINVGSTAGFVDAGVCLAGDKVFNYTAKTATSFTGCTAVIGSLLTDATCDYSDLSTNITMDSTASLAVGMYVSGTNIPDKSTVQSITNSTTFVLSVSPESGSVTNGTLTFTDINPTSAISQHQLQVDLQGGSASGDRGRLRDWWLDHESGIVYFNNSYPFFEWNAIKASYIYGERYLEKGIEDICTKLVAIDLLMSDDRSVLIPEGTQNVDLASKIQLYRADIDKTFPRYKEVVVFE